MVRVFSPTPYADVNEILAILLSNARDILRDQFVGMYLFGSLANGDFDEHSDIDVLVVTDGEISTKKFDSLKELHRRMQKINSPWAVQLEVSYMPKTALRCYDPNHNQHPYLDRGEGEQLQVRPHDSDWVVQRCTLRERGITLMGPEPRSLIDPVSADDVRRAMQSLLFDWYAHFPNKPNPFGSRGYQSYTVLSMCRILYSLDKGDIVSKRAAANWAKETLDPRWLPLIERALEGRQNPRLDPEPEDIRATLAMIEYTLQAAKPTLYPDVNALLNLVLSNVKEILGDQLVGMYLYGSLSGGDFNPETSDIDFLVVTEDWLSASIITELESMHNQTWATSLKRAGELEGAYVPKDLIRRHVPEGAPCPTVNEGRFYLAPLGSDWIIQRHVVREYGVVVEGPDPKLLIDAISPKEIRSSVMSVLREWWFPMLEDPSWLKEHDHAYQAFAVITMCRVLHALEHGTIVSKPKAIQWAREKLGEPRSQLIDKALAASRHESKDDFLDETLGFIRFIREQTFAKG